MLLKSELQAGEIYIEDTDRLGLAKDDSDPGLYQLVEMPVKRLDRNNLFMGSIETETQPIWENIRTGELVTWGTHCFSTFERIKRSMLNIDFVSGEKRQSFIRKAMAVIEKYEEKR